MNETGVPITFPSQITLAQNLPIYGWILSVDVRIIGSVNALNSIIIAQLNSSSGMSSATLEVQFEQLEQIGAIRPYGIEPDIVSINDAAQIYSVSIAPPYPIPVDTFTLSLINLNPIINPNQTNAIVQFSIAYLTPINNGGIIQ